MSSNLEIAIKFFADTKSAMSEIAKMETGVVGIAKNLSAAFGQQALSAMKNYTMEAANLNKELTRISQITNSGKTGAASMYKNVFAYAKNTGVDYKEIVAGYGKFASAGLKLDEIQSSMKYVSQAMVVSNASAEQLSNAVMVASKSFGLDMTKDTGTALDKMFKAGKLGNAELDELSMILGRVGPSAKLAGLGMSETLAFIEGMASSMEGGEIVATMSRSVLKMFNDPKLRAAIEKTTGAQFFDENGKRASAFDIFGKIQEKYLSLGEGLERTNFFEKVFSGADDKTQRGLLTILNDKNSVEKMVKMFNEIENSSGEIKKDADDLMNNMAVQTSIMKSNFKEMTTDAGGVFDKFFTPIMKYSNEVVQAGNKDGALSNGLLVGGGLLAAGGLASKATVLKDTIFGKAMGKAGGGLASAAGGVAKGKVYEQMGVQPVYVVNAAEIGGSGKPGSPGGSPISADPASVAKSASWLSKAGKGAMHLPGAAGLASLLAGQGVALGGTLGVGGTAFAGATAAGIAGTAGLGVAAAGIGVAIGSLFNFVSDEIAKQLTGRTLTDQISDGLAILFNKGFRDGVNGKFGLSREEAQAQFQNAKRAREAAIQNKIDVYIDIDKDGRLIDMKKYEQAGTTGGFGDVLSARWGFGAN